jgi:hypothetical protein
MKLSAIVFLTSIAGVMATPVAEPEGKELVARACKNAGNCSWINGGKCESHCAEYGKKYSHMESCNFGTKKCCCK